MSEPLPLFCALRLADWQMRLACLVCRLRGDHRWRCYGRVEVCERCSAVKETL